LHAARRTEETVLPQEESANYTRPASNDGNTVNWQCEPEYPQSLLQIYDPPVALYVRGDASILERPNPGHCGHAPPNGLWDADG
jgi:predicted Rossmann fold nucleotide-binding protein DprA/Smf involved in DNA uptake